MTTTSRGFILTDNLHDRSIAQKRTRKGFFSHCRTTLKQIKIHYTKSGYFVDILSGLPTKNIVPAKLDTGAFETFANVNVVFDISNELDQVRLNDIFDKYRNNRIEAQSASGHSISAVPVVAEDVNVGGIRLQKFYYLMSYKIGSRFLLGQDFINASKLFHDVGGNFVLESFSEAEYDKYHKAQNRIYVSQTEIEALLTQA